MKIVSAFVTALFAATVTFAAQEELIDSRYRPFAPDAARGDWQGQGYVAQVSTDPSKPGKYEANIFRAFDQPEDKPVAVLHGTKSGDDIALEGDGWTGTISNSHFKASKGAE